MMSALVVLSLLVVGHQAFSAETNSVSADIKDLVTRINSKLQQDKRTESDLAAELKEFDALLAKHKGEDPEDLSQILMAKAEFYLQVLGQSDKAADVIKQIKHDFPQSKIGQRADEILTMLAQQVETNKTQSSPETKSAMADLNDLIQRINAKLVQGKPSEAALTAELNEFDTLLAKHKSADPEAQTQVLLMKAKIYLEVLDLPDKAADVFQQVKRDFPQTQLGRQIDGVLAQVAVQIESKKIRSALAVGTKFPDFDEKDMAGKPLSVANYKGKIVLIDFWSTRCPPCLGELPNLIATYQARHKEGFEIIGISLDEANDKARLESFLKEKAMTWQQYFDGKHFGGKLPVKYGVIKIPSTYLLDGEGKIIAIDLRGEELEKAVSAALEKKYSLNSAAHQQ
jgi:peroxiredoxin